MIDTVAVKYPLALTSKQLRDWVGHPLIPPRKEERPKFFQSASKKPGKAPAELGMGERIPVPTPALVLSRFP